MTTSVQPQFDFNRARQNMVEQQIRTWDVLAQDVLDLLFVVQRENFVPATYRALALSDEEIPLPTTTQVGQESEQETMLTPKMEARLLQALKVRSHETVLEIGTGSGYMAALLAHKAAQVTSVEIRPELKKFAEENLRNAGIQNVKVLLGDGAKGWADGATYDVIVLSGSVPQIPAVYLRQLKAGGRLVAFVGHSPVQVAKLITRADTGEAYAEAPLFDTYVKPLQGVEQSVFKF